MWHFHLTALTRGAIAIGLSDIIYFIGLSLMQANVVTPLNVLTLYVRDPHSRAFLEREARFKDDNQRLSRSNRNRLINSQIFPLNAMTSTCLLQNFRLRTCREVKVPLLNDFLQPKDQGRCLSHLET